MTIGCIKNYTDVDTYISEAIEKLALHSMSPRQLGRDNPRSFENDRVRDISIGFKNSAGVGGQSSPSVLVELATVDTNEKPVAILTNLDDEICPVCLEQIERSHPQSFKTCCSHTFHICCVGKLENTQCPVCRFQHDLPTSELTECLICKSDCNGQLLRHSMRHSIVEENQDLWVCLICGFTGCGRFR